MNDTHKDPDQLERQVNDARANLSQTVDALGEQLSPGQLIDQMFSLTKEQGGALANNLGRQVKDNPLALLLTGVGITWLIAGSGPSVDAIARTSLKTSSHTSQHTPQHSPQHSPDWSSTSDRRTSSSGDSMADDDSMATRVQEQMNESAEAVKAKASAVGSQLERMLRDQPLVMSGLGIALGAALGALIPPSAVEDKLMGAKSDQAVEKATGALTEKYEEERDRLVQKVEESEGAIKQ